MKKNIFSILIVFILLFNNTFTSIVYSVGDDFDEFENVSVSFDDDSIGDGGEQPENIILPDEVNLDDEDDVELQLPDLEDDVIDDNIDSEDDLDVIDVGEVINTGGYINDEIINIDDEIVNNEVNEEIDQEIDEVDEDLNEEINEDVKNEETNNETNQEINNKTDDEVNNEEQELEDQDSLSNIQDSEEVTEEEKIEKQGFLVNLWEIIKSFFLEKKNGYLVGSEIIDNVTISIEAKEGILPDGTEVVIKGVPQDRFESIQTSLIDDETNKITEDTQILAFDISFVYSGEEIQPNKEISVKFNYQENIDFQGASISEVSVYHIDDETDEGTEIQVTKKQGDEIEILATDFSVYILALTENNTITLTLDPGDGTIVAGENITVNEQGIGTIVSSNGNVTLPNATRADHVLVGWYTSQTPSLQSFVGSGGDEYYVDNNITLYASWCNDGYVINTEKTACILSGNLKTIMDQNPNFTYGEIEILKPDSIYYGPSSYTIMDRDLGALNAGTDSGAYGYYYQFGNNRGFSGGTIGVIAKATALVDLSLYAAKENPYYSGNFVYGNSSIAGSSPQDWAVVPNDNIWGGTSTEYLRQGPCPSGWHVPTTEEWQDVIDYWTVSGGMTTGVLNSSNIASFRNDLKLTLAGERARKNYALSNVGSVGNYRTTEVSPVVNNSGGRSYIFRITSNGGVVVGNSDYNRVNGQSIRCFKNSEIVCDIDEHLVGDECVSNTMTGFCMTGAEISNGYYTGIDLEINISWNGRAWDIPVCDIICNDGYFLINDQCFLVEGYTITFELNGGLWYDGYAGNRTTIVEAGNDASTARPIIDPYKNNYMFMGWFDESSNSTTRYKFQGTIITGDLTLTAHWAPFNDIVYTGIVGGEEKRVILMDRNLGAIATGAGVVTTPESYGYYYQWGNNYGFYYDNGTSINSTISQKIYNANGFGPGNWFYGEIFTKGFTDWSSVSVNNLWGGVGDQESNNYDNGNKRYNRQGPCPKGYHVPSLGEWHKLIRLFMNNEYPDHNSTNILNTSWKNNIGNGNDANYALTQTMFNDILNTFYIPSAGRVTTAYAWNRMGSNPGSDGYRAPFWSSTIINDSRALGFEMRFKDVKFNLGGWDDERAGAKPVRCFKDDEDYIVLWKNYDGTVLEADYYVYEGATPSYDEPENPTRNGYKFIGWYLSGDENQTVVNLSGQTVTGNRTYMAKYILNSGKYEVVLYTGRGVESVSGGGIFDVGDSIIITGTLKTGYENLVWTGDFDTSEFIMPENNVVMTGMATPINYTISYDVGLGYITGQKTTYTIEEGFTIPDPIRTGFEFLGWSGTNLLVLTSGLVIDTGTYGNLNYEAIWKDLGETTYNVYHYIKVAGEERYEQYGQVIVYTGTVGSVIILTGHQIEIPCLTYTGGSLDLSFSGLTNQIWTTTVLDGGSRNIYLYYTRNTYTLTLGKDANIDSVLGAGVYECGQSVTINALPKTGYHFKRRDGVLDDSG